MGQGDQSPQAFLQSMQNVSKSGLKPIAVHTNFHPGHLKSLCQQAGADFSVIVRDPVKQVRSCYAWAISKALGGDENILARAVRANQTFTGRLGLPQNLSNGLYAFAVNHVMEYNFGAMANAIPMYRMEDLLRDETLFREVYQIDAAQRIPHFDGESVHQASHTGKTEDVELAEPDGEIIRNAVELKTATENLSFSVFAQRLGYH